jgi:hypothetical protein
MDAVGSTRWSTTAASGEIDQALGNVVDREWRRLLEHAPELRLEKVTITSNATTGRYSISDLSTGSGNAAHRFYRIQNFSIDGYPYQESKFSDYSQGEDLGLSMRVYWREGDYIMALPKALSESADVWISHLPVRVESLNADSDTIIFPDGYEELYILESAAMALAKGGAETGATAELKALANDIRSEMIQDLSRFGKGTMRMRFDDYPTDWAG